MSSLRSQKLIGIYDGCTAFPVQDNGSVVATHYKTDDGWGYYPTGFGVRPFIIGDLAKAKQVHIGESQWDMLTLADRTDWYLNENHAFIATRGAGNAAICKGLIPDGVSVLAWPQNDDAGAKWLTDLVACLPMSVAKAVVPEQFEDINDWTRSGASAEQIHLAFFKNEIVSEALAPEKLFGDIKRYLLRYVVLSQPEHADVIALWVMHTWVVDKADFTPYLYVHSPVMRCGKTQLHRVVEPLVKDPLRTCNVSESVLFRVIEDRKPTLLWDEIDSVFGNRKSAEAHEDKRALINAGYERGLVAIRMERGPHGFVPVQFDPFCAKILSGIGRLPDTIVDRSIPILIHRRLKSQPCQKFRRADRDQGKPIHDALARWASGYFVKDPPRMPDGLSDRQEDIWEPLLAIADSVGGQVPELAREAAQVLCHNGDDDGSGFGTRQLLAIRRIIGDQDRISSADLINGLWEADELPSRLLEDDEPNYKKIGHWLSKFIKSYGGQPARKLRFGEGTAKGYTASELKPIFDRYCPET
jgi:uncharacterized protein DUF3631